MKKLGFVLLSSALLLTACAVRFEKSAVTTDSSKVTALSEDKQKMLDKATADYKTFVKEQIDKPTHPTINSFEFYEYEKSLGRMEMAHIPNFDKVLNAPESEINGETDVEKYVEEYKKSLLTNGRPPEANEDWKEYCQEYFRGSKDYKTYAGSEINIRTYADRVLSMEKVLDNIRKERSSLDSGFSKVISSIQRDGKKQDAEKAKEDNNASNTEGTTNPVNPKS